MSETHELLTAQELGERLKVSESAIRRWLCKGWIPGIRLTGRATRFNYEAVLNALKKRQSESDNHVVLIEEGDDRQKSYQTGWDRFCKFAKDSSPKICSDAGLNVEFGEKLRELMQNDVLVACLKLAFADGWRAQTDYFRVMQSRCSETEEAFLECLLNPVEKINE